MTSVCERGQVDLGRRTEIAPRTRVRIALFDSVCRRFPCYRTCALRPPLEAKRRTQPPRTLLRAVTSKVAGVADIA